MVTNLQPIGTEENLGVVGAIYVDTIVEKHARRILGEGKLRDLGKLAAHLDFHLVTWLAKEKRRRSTVVSDFVGALKMIHSEFEWPYPDFAPTQPHHSRTPSTGEGEVFKHGKRILNLLFLFHVRFC